MIQELPSTGNKTPQLPLIEESCSAVQDILSHIYDTFRPRKQPTCIRDGASSSADWSVFLNVLRLAHKYGMSSIEMAQQEIVQLPLTALVDAPYSATRSSLVLDIAKVAQECECQSMLASCEAFVVKHFRDFAARGHKEKLSKLSSASLLRVSQGLVQSYEATLEAYAKEAKICSNRIKPESGCPRCSGAMNSARNPSGNYKHKKTGSTCTWPEARMTPQQTVKASNMAAYFEDLAKRQH